MNPLIIELLVAERSAEIRRDVQRLHLIAQYHAHRSEATRRISWWVRLWIATGELLIRAGEWIKARYAQKMEIVAESGPERCYPSP